jgi:hypothetical protein
MDLVVGRRRDGRAEAYQAGARKIAHSMASSGSCSRARATIPLPPDRPISVACMTLFSGDVINYLGTRGTPDAAGESPRRVLGKLAEARAAPEALACEPLEVLSHSMGGQIVYGLVTYFLPNMAECGESRVDFWCATAS